MAEGTLHDLPAEPIGTETDTDQTSAVGEPYAQLTAVAASERLVIIGNGMVSHRLCETLMARNPQRYDVTVFAEENRPAYDRVHLGDVLGGREAGSLLLSPERWYDDHSIELHLGNPVVGLDLRQRMVLTYNGAHAVRQAHHRHRLGAPCPADQDRELERRVRPAHAG